MGFAGVAAVAGLDLDLDAGLLHRAAGALGLRQVHDALGAGGAAASRTAARCASTAARNAASRPSGARCPWSSRSRCSSRTSASPTTSASGCGWRGCRDARPPPRWPRCSSGCSSVASGERRPGELSGGQEQRVSLARALVRRPRVLLLDEPFSQLDVDLRAQMRALVRELHDEADVTTLLVTHDREEAVELADRITVMLAGAAVGSGTPEEIYSAPPTLAAARFFGVGNEVTGVVVGGRFRGRPGRARDAERPLPTVRPCWWSVPRRSRLRGPVAGPGRGDPVRRVARRGRGAAGRRPAAAGARRRRCRAGRRRPGRRGLPAGARSGLRGGPVSRKVLLRAAVLVAVVAGLVLLQVLVGLPEPGRAPLDPRRSGPLGGAGVRAASTSGCACCRPARPRWSRSWVVRCSGSPWGCRSCCSARSLGGLVALHTGALAGA